MGKKRHQPSKPRPLSLVELYGKQTGRHVAEIDIDDPYAAPQHDAATVLPGPGRGANDGPKEWQAPRSGRIKVLASTRDAVAGMYACRHIDEAMFNAARKYQRLHELAGWASAVKSVDIAAPQVSGSTRDYSAGLDQALAARDEMKDIDAQIVQKLGEDGVELLRDILGRGMTIETAAAQRGEGDKHRVGWWGGFFRRCLRHLAEVTGFAVRNAYANRQRENDRQDFVRRREEENTKKRKKGGRREAQEEPAT
jgi:hypothetical protein